MTADELNNLFKMFLNKVLEEYKDLFNSIINYIKNTNKENKAQLKTDFVEKFVKYYNTKFPDKINNKYIIDENGNGRIQFVMELINTLFDDVKLSSDTDFDKKYFIHIIQSYNDNKITEIIDNNYTLKAIYYPDPENSSHYIGYYKCKEKWYYYNNQKLPIKDVNIDDLTQKSESYLFFVRNEEEETKDETKTEETKDETEEKEFDITKNYLNDFLEINTTQFNILKNKKKKKLDELKNKKKKKLDELENDDKQKIIELMNKFIENHKQNLKDYKFKNKDNKEKTYKIKNLNKYKSTETTLQQYFNNLKNVVKENLKLYIDNIEVKNLNQLISKLEIIFKLNEDVSENNFIEFIILLLLKFNNVFEYNKNIIRNYFKNNDEINNLIDEILNFNNNYFYKDNKYNYDNINKLYNLQDNFLFILNDYYSCYELINYIRDKIKLKIDFDFTNCINDVPRLLDIYYNKYGINDKEKIKTPKFNKDTKYIIDEYLTKIDEEYIEDKDAFINLLQYINVPNSIKKEENKFKLEKNKLDKNKLDDFKESEEDILKCNNIVNKFKEITNFEIWNIDCNEDSYDYKENIIEIYKKKYNGETNLNLINLDFNDFSYDIIDEYMKQINKNKIETKEEFEGLINFIKSKKSLKSEKDEEIKIIKITDNELEQFEQNDYYDWLGWGFSKINQKYKLFEPNRFNVINKNNNEYYNIIPLYYIENINNINNNNLDIINEYLNNNLKVYPENDYPEKYKENNDLLTSFENKKKNNLPFWLSLGKFYLKIKINEKINIHINNAWSDHMVKGYGKVVTCFIINYFKNKYPNKELYITLKEGGESSKAWKRHGFVPKSKEDTHPFIESFSHKLDINESKKICTETLEYFNITEFKYYEIDNQTGGKIDKIIENMVNEYNNKKVKRYKIVKKLN